MQRKQRKQRENQEIADDREHSSRQWAQRAAAAVSTALLIIEFMLVVPSTTSVVYAMHSWTSYSLSACQTYWTEHWSYLCQILDILSAVSFQIIGLGMSFMYFSFRYGPDLLDKLGLRKELGTMLSFSWKIYAVIGIHAVSFGFALLGQYITGRWYFSFDNYLNSQGKWSIPATMQLIITAPIIEEIILRGVLLILLLEAKITPFYSVIVSSCVFGLMHFMNFGTSLFNDMYIILQMIVGIIVGVFLASRLVTRWSMRPVISGNIIECIALHITNNLMSSFVSATSLEKGLMTDWIVFIPQIMMFSGYLLFAWKELMLK